MGADRIPTSTHHLIPTSRNGPRFDPRNVRELAHKYHVAFHVVMANRTPDEQIALIIDLNSTVLSEDFKKAVNKALDKGDEFVYEDGLYIPRR